MKVYCSTEILSALRSINFPKTKNEILSIAEDSNDISEASIICLNKIEDRVYYSADEICENIKIACSLELRDALSEIEFPVTKSEIIQKFQNKNYPLTITKAIEELPENQVFNGISDICL